MTRATATPRRGITVHRFVVDKVIRQARVAVKLVLTGPAIVANQLVGGTGGKARHVAWPKRAIVVAAFVLVGKETIKDAGLQVAGLWQSKQMNARL